MTKDELIKSLQRSIDCLQRLYALLLALAANEMFKRFIDRPAGSNHPQYHWDWLPDVLTFVFTLVPVYHGMHRHLDRTYSTPVRGKQRSSLRRFFVIDIALNWLAFILFFILQLNVGLREFIIYFAAILFVNSLWGIAASFAPQGEFIASWAILNCVATFLAFILGLSQDLVPDGKTLHWTVAGIAIVRTLLDYGLAWDVYFPPKPDDATW